MPTRPRLRQSTKAGLQPGSLVHIGVPSQQQPVITITEYDANSHSVRVVDDLTKEPAGCRTNEGSVVWVNVTGVNNPDTIALLGERFSLHALVLEDVMNTGQRIKIDEYDDSVFVVLKMINVDKEEDVVVVEQTSFVLGDGFVITFQEREADVFNGLRDRLKHNKGRIRKSGADYLLYALIDVMVDHYAVALDAMAELVYDMEHDLQEQTDEVSVNDLYLLKREVNFLRRQIAPARDVLGKLCHLEDEDRLSDAVDLYFKDVLDHCVRATEHVDLLRDVVSGLVDMYHSLQGARLNEVMRVLTVISTVFMPLTFIAGIYGMNFQNMPELSWENGYFICLAVMGVITVGMALYIRRNKWL